MNDNPKNAMLANQMLAGALAAGVAMFAIVSLVIVLLAEGPLMDDAGELELILLGAAALAWVGSVVAAFVISSTMIAQARRAWREKPGQGPADLTQQYASFMILRAALLEAPGLFGVTVFLLTANWLGLLIAALSVAAIAAIFPTPQRFNAYAAQVMRPT